MLTCPSCAAVSPEGTPRCARCSHDFDAAAAARPAPLPDTVLRAAVGEEERGRKRGAGLALAPGAILLKRFRIVHALGRGGMGEVFRADDLKLGQRVALKFVAVELLERPGTIERFRAEVSLAREIAHPFVCRVYDLGEHRGRPFLAMEYVEGENLGALHRRIGRLPYAKALEVAHQLCAGLGAVHERGLLHLDIKPSNVMVDASGRVRLTDFGLALRQSPGSPGAGSRAGTPAYLAPELFAGAEATVRSDLYSLGLVLYELFTGHSAFDAEDVEAWRHQHQQRAPRAMKSRGGTEVGTRVEEAVLRCLEKEPDRRPGSAREVAAALPPATSFGAISEGSDTPPPELVAYLADTPTPGRMAQRVWLGLALAGTLVAAILSVRASGLDAGARTLSPAALAARAREIAVDFGFDADGGGDAGGFALLGPIQARAPEARSADPIVYWHRHAPSALWPDFREWVTGSVLGQVTPDSPPANGPRTWSVVLDAHGNLRRWQGRIDARARPWEGSVDWRPALAAAFGRPSDVRPEEPRWLPDTGTASVAGWRATGAVPAFAVGGGASGRILFFEQREQPEEPVAPYYFTAARRPVQARLHAIVWVAVTAASVLVARRNLRIGRSDRRGARRLALFGFAVFTLAWALRADHVAEPVIEALSFFAGLGTALAFAGALWLGYLALEPTVRRREPGLLVAWMRALSGRWRDPAVGYALLAGLALGALHRAVQLASGLLSHGAANSGDRTLQVLRGLDGSFWSWIVRQHAYAVLQALGLLAFLVLVLRVVKRRPVALALTFALLAVLNATEGGRWLSVAAGTLSALLILVALRGYGLLAASATFLASGLLRIAPIGFDPARWYFPRGVVVVLYLVGLLCFAYAAAAESARRRAAGSAPTPEPVPA